MQAAGLRLCLITNQQGIGLGYFGYHDFVEGNQKLLRLLERARKGIAISKIYFCPHSVGESCDCRKPAPGLILRALREQNIAADRCFVVGDSPSDIEAARAAGCAGFYLGAIPIREAAQSILAAVKRT